MFTRSLLHDISLVSAEAAQLITESATHQVCRQKWLRKL